MTIKDIEISQKSNIPAKDPHDDRSNVFGEISELFGTFSISPIRTVLTLDNPTHEDYLIPIAENVS